MISSAIPSQRYCWSFAGLMSANGSTAIEMTVGRLAAESECAVTRASEPRLAKSVDEVLDVLGLVPLFELQARAAAKPGRSLELAAPSARVACPS